MGRLLVSTRDPEAGLPPAALQVGGARPDFTTIPLHGSNRATWSWLPTLRTAIG